MKPLALWLSALLLVILSGCISFGPTPTVEQKPLYSYRADMKMTADGKLIEGMGTADLKPTVQIEATSPAKPDVLIVSTCSRSEKFEGLKSKFSYTYKPTGIERDSKCPIYIQAFDNRGLIAWGYIAFKSDEGLVANIDCNGQAITSTGVSVCQVQAGLEQAIRFDHDIRYYEASSTCQMELSAPGIFKLKPQLGFCYATFSDGKDWHALTVLGYEQAIVRGN